MEQVWGNLMLRLGGQPDRRPQSAPARAPQSEPGSRAMTLNWPEQDAAMATPDRHSRATSPLPVPRALGSSAAPALVGVRLGASSVSLSGAEPPRRAAPRRGASFVVTRMGRQTAHSQVSAPLYGYHLDESLGLEAGRGTSPGLLCGNAATLAVAELQMLPRAAALAVAERQLFPRAASASLDSHSPSQISPRSALRWVLPRGQHGLACTL